MPQGLTDKQKAALDQSIPALGTKGSGAASDLIQSLFLLGGKIVNYTSNATINTQDTVAHGLGYTPQGYIVIGIGAAAIVYSTQASDATNLYLKCNVASTTVTLLVF